MRHFALTTVEKVNLQASGVDSLPCIGTCLRKKTSSAFPSETFLDRSTAFLNCTESEKFSLVRDTKLSETLNVLSGVSELTGASRSVTLNTFGISVAKTLMHPILGNMSVIPGKANRTVAHVSIMDINIPHASRISGLAKAKETRRLTTIISIKKMMPQATMKRKPICSFLSFENGISIL